MRTGLGSGRISTSIVTARPAAISAYPIQGGARMMRIPSCSTRARTRLPFLGHEFRYQVSVESLRAAFTPVTAFLHAAERRFRGREPEVVDRHHARFESVAQHRRV